MSTKASGGFEEWRQPGEMSLIVQDPPTRFRIWPVEEMHFCPYHPRKCVLWPEWLPWRGRGRVLVVTWHTAPPTELCCDAGHEIKSVVSTLAVCWGLLFTWQRGGWRATQPCCSGLLAGLGTRLDGLLLAGDRAASRPRRLSLWLDSGAGEVVGRSVSQWPLAVLWLATGRGSSAEDGGR